MVYMILWYRIMITLAKFSKPLGRAARRVLLTVVIIILVLGKLGKLDPIALHCIAMDCIVLHRNVITMITFAMLLKPQGRIVREGSVPTLTIFIFENQCNALQESEIFH